MHRVEVKGNLSIWPKTLEEVGICCCYDPQNLMGDAAKCLLLPEHADADLFLRRRAASASSQEPQVGLTGALWDPPMAGLGPRLHQSLTHEICLKDLLISNRKKQHIFYVGPKVWHTGEEQIKTLATRSMCAK